MNYKAKTWSLQDRLPKLPVAPLIPTLEKYLRTIRPLVDDEQYEITKNKIVDFLKPNGIGDQSFKLLEEKAKNSKTHWLEDWWDHYSYFAPRDPIALNVNFFFHFDILKPRQISQVRRAASLVRGALEFKYLLDNEELVPDMRKGKPLDMAAFKWMFDTCRIPRHGSDCLKKYSKDESKHIVVIKNSNFYYFDVIVDNMPLTLEQIETQLRKIVEISQTESKGVPIGVLTADNRDIWTDVHNKILERPMNQESLEKIQSAIFVLCLEETIPLTAEEISRGLWHGDAGNRWFDKSIQLIVFPNGVCGLNGEHSKLDGLPVGRLSDFIVTFAPQESNRNLHLEDPKKLGWSFSDEILSDISASLNRFRKFVNQFELQTFNFLHYGKLFITKYELSPDAYFQNALQYTYFRMFGQLCATYESASTKKFLHGRTEVGRSASIEALAWVKSMTSLNFSLKEKQELLRNACKHHSDYMKAATDGLGVDRLLLGLRLIAQENGLPKHEIFTDEAYINSTHWKLSTSQMSSPNYYVGFGPVVFDGFGVCYCLRDMSIHAHITSFATHPQTRVKNFCQELRKSFFHMQMILEANITAKL